MNLNDKTDEKRQEIKNKIHNIIDQLISHTTTSGDERDTHHQIHRSNPSHIPTYPN